MIDPQRHAVLWLLIAFIATTALTRLATRAIRHRADRAERYLKERSRPGLFRNIAIAGIHVHHQVWGILILLFTGLLLITYTPEHGPVLNGMAALFGIGAALTLDEFAMWLHLEDVYWRDEGRTSISALIVATVITAALVIGANPLNIIPGAEGVPGFVIAGAALCNLVFVVTSILKGKLITGLVGVFVPFVSIIGAGRLAKPGSWWAQRIYADDGRLDARSRARFGPEYDARWNAARDLIGGKPYSREQLVAAARAQRPRLTRATGLRDVMARHPATPKPERRTQRLKARMKAQRGTAPRRPKRRL